VRRRLAGALLVVMLLATCTSGTPIDADGGASTTGTPTASPPDGPLPADVALAGLQLRPFGSFSTIPLLDGREPYPGPVHPSSLTDVFRTPYVERALTDQVTADRLVELGFVVVPAQYRHFHHLYEEQFYDGFPVFVTTDVALHAWHLVFDKVLRDLERDELLPRLERLLAATVTAAREQRDRMAGTDLADASDRAAQLYEAAATLLGLDIGPIGELARQEIELVEEAAELTASPITSFGPCTPQSTDNCVNYALFRPRGHYTRDADLERYFRAMSVLGQDAFFLDADSLRVGLLATRALLASEQTISDWQAVYEPTSFLVGAADDHTPFELATAAAQVVPEGLDDPTAFVTVATLEEVAEALRTSRPVLINPEAASVRLMGVRFTWDAYALDQLVDPAVPGRFDASAFDVAAAMGSDWALTSQLAVLEANETGGSLTDDYLAQIERLRAEVGARTGDDWGRTVYDAWLYALVPLWSPYGTAFPEFMRTEAWAAKAHQTGFGSYAELKHDTLLYAKQAVAEGGGEQPPSRPRHWVEPDPVTFRRLAAAAALFGDGLDDRGLLGSEPARTVRSLTGWLGSLARLADDELAGRAITEEDNLALEATGGFLEELWLRTSDLVDRGEDAGPDQEAAIVADILTSAGFGALEIGTGHIDTLLVLVPDDTGRFQVAVGGTYSFYEFWQDPSQRLTDEQWRVLLASDDAPQRPSWQQLFLVP
jgi:hypothetical protein